MSKVRMSILFSSGSLYVFQIVNLAFSMFVARNLTPFEIGVFAIVAAISMSSSEFKLLGTGDYLIRESISEEKVKNTLGLSILSSWSIALLMVTFSGVISDFYSQPDIQYLLILLSASFWLAPFSSTNFSLLRKEFDYLKNTAIGWTSRLSMFGSSVILVLYEYSYFGLAAGIAIGAIVEFILTLLWHSPHMSFIPKFNNLRPILKFGSLNTLANFATQQSKLSFDLIIGKVGNPAAVAMYSKGNGLVDFVGHFTIGGLQGVALPYLTKENKTQNDFKDAYLKSSRLALSLLLPILASAAILKYELMHVLFGDQWKDAVALVPYITLWYILANFHPFAKQALISKGLEKNNLFIELINLAAVAVNIFIFYESGLIVIAQGMIFVGVLKFSLINFVLSNSLNLSLFTYFRNQLTNILITCICVTVALSMKYIMQDQDSNFLVLIVSGVALVFTWLLSAFLLKHEIYNEISKLISKKG